MIHLSGACLETACMETKHSFFKHFVWDWPGHHRGAGTSIFGGIGGDISVANIFQAQVLTPKTFFYRSLRVQGLHQCQLSLLRSYKATCDLL